MASVGKLTQGLDGPLETLSWLSAPACPSPVPLCHLPATFHASNSILHCEAGAQLLIASWDVPRWQQMASGPPLCQGVAAPPSEGLVSFPASSQLVRELLQAELWVLESLSSLCASLSCACRVRMIIRMITPA